MQICDKSVEKDDQPYSLKTIQHTLAGLQRKVLDNNHDTTKFLDSSQSFSLSSDVHVTLLTMTCIPKELEQQLAMHLRSLQTT